MYHWDDDGWVDELFGEATEEISKRLGRENVGHNQNEVLIFSTAGRSSQLSC